MGSLAVTASSSAYLPVGSRIHSIQGEADGKPTYDFVITFTYTDTTPTAQFTQIKYAGARNGQKVNLMKDWPQVITKAAAAAAVGDFALQITSGTGVALQVYYISGAVTV